MNWAGISVVIGMVAVAMATMPYGIAIFIFIGYVMYKS